MKRMFKEECEIYSTEGLNFLSEVRAALHPILTEYFTQGYSPRDMGLIVAHAGDDWANDRVLRHGAELRKAKHEKSLSEG